MKTKPKSEPDGSFAPIDLGKLEEEWVKQDGRVGRYGKLKEEAKRRVAHLEQNLDVKKAQIDRLIRKRPSKYGMEKLTEPGVKAALILEPEIIKLETQLIEERHLVNMYQVALNRLEHRKKALEDLVDLWKNSYFSKPREKDSDSTVMATERKKKLRKMGGV